ncbi:homoserine dehydrogenase [Candidatus Pelagibacter sp. IMCC9063]|uniref:homoserine dehydrogenase n=1 Tax=Pelagibacter sp. (strain IMCC9063) TaxID=1002672 RepID=UPI0002046824|nr:homoserine dehydrogenase [Candidatus Pelagibacter sp. IMCC9063]AEA81596.1 homoserine dehydrogenase [Candidatus Pelagibacter sp. IMCC9063]
MKTFNIAIAGLGNIGLEVYKNLTKNKKNILEKTGFKINISHISVKNPRKKRGISLPKKLFVTSPLDLVKLENVDIIVELIGGSDGMAKKLVFAALKNGKHVVTANKALIAKHGDELSILAEKNSVNLLFEASVAGGIPIIKSIKQGLIANKINHVYGILNGTTNFILTEMEKKQSSFKEILKVAQSKGYAESNPHSDISGADVASKISILSSICFGSKIVNSNFLVEGISHIDLLDILYAKKLGFKIKLLAIAEMVNNKIKQRVHPSLIPSTLDISNIDGVTNAVVVDGVPIGRTIYEGAGAGKGPTSSAIISDITSVMVGNDDFSFGLSPSAKKTFKLFNFNDHKSKYYFRFLAHDKPGVLSVITSLLAKNKISIQNLIQDPDQGNLSSIMIITHLSKEKDIQVILKKLRNKKNIFKKIVMIRVRDENKL